MQYKLLIFNIALLLAGCTTLQSTPEQSELFQSPNRLVEKPILINPPKPKMNYHLTEGNNPALERAYQTFLKTGIAKNISGDGFVQFAYGINQPVVAASPFELTAISLEPGESITNVSSGDPMRWSYTMAYSGKSDQKQAHVLVKPSQAGISTDLVITTDKRMYTIKIAATDNGKYVRNVSFWYPLDIKDYWEKYNVAQAQKITEDATTNIATTPNIDINSMNFNYTITGNGWFSKTPSWKPVRAFDDGTHTYIQFPVAMSYRDMPALFIKNDNKQELVNYRSKPPYFVIDKIFKEAVLIMGAGSGQERAIIRNNHY